MTRLGAVLWIILSFLLLLFPLGFLSYYLIRYFKKSSKFFSQKIAEIKELDTMKDVILQEIEEEELQSDSWSITIVSQSTTVTVDMQHSDKEQDNQVGSIVHPDIQTIWKPTITIEQEYVQKDIEHRQKKLLEKIRYEALLSKEKWKIDEFEKKLVEGLAIDSDNLEFNQMLAELYFTLGNYKKSLTLLKKVIEIEPQDHKAIWQIGEIYLSKGEFETAELLVEKAIELKPSNPKYYISMVEVYYNTNRKDIAIDTLEKVVKLRPANVPYLLALADLYFEIGSIENAQRYYFRVLEYEPSNVKAKNKIQKIVS